MKTVKSPFYFILIFLLSCVMGITFKPLSCFTIQDSSRGYDSYERRKLYILQYIVDTSHYIEKPS